MATARKPPWKRPRPKIGAAKKLTAAQKSAAKARAKAAGRRYPNLVDNMWAARKQGAGRKTAAKKSAAKKTTRRAATKS